MAIKREIDEIELPTDLAEAFRRAGRLDEPPKTLEDGSRAVIDRLNEAGVAVTLEDMYQSEPTRHAVHVGDTVKHVPCVMDALIVALQVDTDPVEIHSEPPGDGETVRFRVTDDEVTVAPTSAVVSYGLGLEESTEDLDSIKDTLNDPDSPIPTTCSVINAFPDSETYERWAENISQAAVMKLSPEEVLSLSQQAVQSHIGERESG